MDMRHHITLTTLEAWKGMYGYAIAEVRDRTVTLVFQNIRHASSFAAVTDDSDGYTYVSLLDPVVDFHSPVFMAVTLTIHPDDICGDCNGCKRNACDSHRLCSCEPSQPL